MKKKSILCTLTRYQLLAFAAALLLVEGPNAWGANVGISTFPLVQNKKFLSAEFNSVVSKGGGDGVQGRFTQRVSESISIDAGIGVNGGIRATGRAFVGADFEVYPDYVNQPRFSVKAALENAKEIIGRVNKVTFAPTISKGFSFWGKEAYPFVSFPLGLGLMNSSSRYETIANLNFGINGKIPLSGMAHLIGVIEASVSLKDSYSSINAGVSFPMN